MDTIRTHDFTIILIMNNSTERLEAKFSIVLALILPQMVQNQLKKVEFVCVF